MAKSKLKSALERHKGVDHRLEHQKKLQKQAEKRKRQKTEHKEDQEALEDAVAEVEAGSGILDQANGIDHVDEDQAADKALLEEQLNGQANGWETDDSEEGQPPFDFAALEDDSDDDSDSADEDFEQDGAEQPPDFDGKDEDQEDIPLSDIDSLASEDKGDVIPHQRLTINNTAALQRALKSFALPKSLPFSANQVLTTSEPVAIEDVEDDLNRELSFYKQSLEASKQARALLKAEGLPFSRPADYFAEMVKSDEHMGKIKQKLVDEAAGKKASSEARRQRDLKKFGKQVQVAKLQERDKAKRDTMEKINLLKRKRQGAELGAANEDNLFDVALEDAAVTEKKDKAARRENGGRVNKRQKKDERFGFGGKKRFAKSNDAKSSADTRGFSVKKMKGKQQRPGKSKRANKF